MSRPTTLKELEATGYRPRAVRDELRANLNRAPARGRAVVRRHRRLPAHGRAADSRNAILSRHDFILLGLRGQAKTRLLRSLVPVPRRVGARDPRLPAEQRSRCCRCRITRAVQLETHGHATPITWIHRDQRYQEKLATPDVTIADLIGDIDPIKAATLRLDYSDERVIHYGIIPRTNRGVFAINELPDLQPRIQVGLLNILEEKDFQIRGFPVRMPLDVVMVFSANPEGLYQSRQHHLAAARPHQFADHPRTTPLTPANRCLEITAQESWTRRGRGRRGGDPAVHPRAGRRRSRSRPARARVRRSELGRVGAACRSR